MRDPRRGCLGDECPSRPHGRQPAEKGHYPESARASGSRFPNTARFFPAGASATFQATHTAADVPERHVRPALDVPDEDLARA